MHSGGAPEHAEGELPHLAGISYLYEGTGTGAELRLNRFCFIGVDLMF